MLIPLLYVLPEGDNRGQVSDSVEGNSNCAPVNPRRSPPSAYRWR